MAKKKDLDEKWAPVVEALKTVYPDARCALTWGSGEEDGWRLLVMGMLSAQCTDARVNMVSPALFAAFPTPRAMADADIGAIEEKIQSCGLYHTKAKNIQSACLALCERFGGRVPSGMDDLLSLPGVGRKIANLIRGDLFGLPGIVADTHCIRICSRLGLTPEDCRDPVQTERIVTPLIAPGEQSDFCHRLVQFGRDTCSARAPKCDGCPLGEYCRAYQKRQ